MRRWSMAMVVGLLMGCGGEARKAPSVPVQVMGKPAAEWIRELQGDDVLAREEALLVLRTNRAALLEAAPVLRMLLKDETRSVRVKAAIALSSIDRQSKEAREILVETLHNGRGAERREAASALGPIAAEAPAVLHALLKAAQDTDSQLSATAGDALRSSPNVVSALAKLVQDPKAEFRQAAIEQLARLGVKAKAALPVLVGCLKDADWKTRFQAAQAVWFIGSRSKSALPVLIEAAGKPDASDRRTAFRLLVQAKPLPKEAMAIVRAALADEELEIQLQAAGILWEGEKSLDGLLVLAKAFDVPEHRHGLSRNKFAQALREQEVAAKVPRETLLRLMNSGDPSLQVALPPLVARAGPDVIPTLVAMMDNKQYGVRSLAGATLGLLGKDAVEPLVKLLDHADNQVRQSALTALHRIGPEAKAAIPALIPCLKSADLVQRRSAALCLGTIGGDAKDAVPALMECCKDNDPSVRRAAIIALGGIHPADVPVHTAVEQALGDSQISVRMAAVEVLWHLDPKSKPALDAMTKLISEQPGYNTEMIRLLARMGPAAKPVFPVLVKMLKSPNANERYHALNSLTSLGPLAKEAAPALIESLRDPDAQHRANVARVLQSMQVRDDAVLPALFEIIDLAPANTQIQMLKLAADYGPRAKAFLPKLREHLTSTEPGTRLAALEVLFEIEPGQIAYQRRMLEEFMRTDPASSKVIPQLHGLSAARIWLKADPHDARPLRFLTDKLKDTNPSTRIQVAQALTRCGPWAKALVPPLTEAVEGESPMVRALAAKALWKIDPANPRIVPALIGVLQGQSEMNSTQVAAEALGDMGAAAREALPVLRAAAQPPGHLSVVINDAIRKIDPKAARFVLTP